MDDEDSKVRRNLVVASMVILLAVWLRAPLEGMAEALFRVKPTGADFVWRVWAASGVALIYFALRYRFSPDHIQALEPLQVEYAKIEQQVLKQWLLRVLRRFVRTGNAGPLPTAEMLSMVEAHRGAAARKDEPYTDVTLTRIDVNEVARTADRYPAYDAIPLKLVGAKLTLIFQIGEEQRAADVSVGIDLSATSIFRIRLNAFGWVLFYSRGSTHVLFPWALASLAFVAVLYKVLRTVPL